MPSSLPAQSIEVVQWLAEARTGSPEALGRIFESCRQYLLLIANQQVDAVLGVKKAPSDFVQDTLLKAHGDFEQFRGLNEAELLGWLRRILLNAITDANRQYRQSDKRNLEREAPQADSQEREQLEQIPDNGRSPSAIVAAHAQDKALQQALSLLSPERQQVIRWRNYDRVAFEEIGKRLGRSAEAARKLWTRSLHELQTLMEPSHDDAK